MGQTEITGRCDGLMPKNGEHNVVVFLYGVSRRLLINLTDLCWKPLASFGLRMDAVPMAYHHMTPVNGHQLMGLDR
jgi:hypothetical protein